MIEGLPGKLKELRSKYGLTQKQIAERVGVSPSIVSGYETGERTPSTEVLLALSRLFHTSTDYLLGRKAPGQEILVDLDGLTEKQKAAVILLVQAMKESTQSDT